MTELQLYRFLAWGWFFLALVVFVFLFFVSAPYGRHFRKGWGPLIRSRWAWMLMEAPASLGMLLWFCIGDQRTVSWIFLILWQSHYLYRAFIYPFRLRDARPMPLSVMLMAFIFNLGNTYFIGRYLFSLSGGYDPDWLTDPRFVMGFLLFAAGMLLTRDSDRRLHQLRRKADTTYSLPEGGGFRWVSCPNYLGEIVQWTGWALATWSPGGVLFAVWTVANLMPRARSHHFFYLQVFPDYPKKRRALFPHVW